MSLLLYVFHPNYAASEVNKALVEEARKVPGVEVVVVSDPAQIDTKVEQTRIAKHSNILFQYPVWWLSPPDVYHRFMQQVYEYGWAYSMGEAGYQPGALAGKTINVAISFGNPLPDAVKGFGREVVYSPLVENCKVTFSKFGEAFDTRKTPNLPEYVSYIERIANK